MTATRQSEAVISPAESQPALRKWGNKPPSLGGDLRTALVDAAGALLLSAFVYALYMDRVRAGADIAVQEMPEMLRNGGLWAYSLSQAVGWAALLWSWLTIMLGVSVPLWSRLRRPQARRIAERIHRSTGLTVVGLIVGHAVLLNWANMGDTLVTDFVPYATTFEPGKFPQALGIVSLYLAMLLGLTFYLRDRIGLRTWKMLHRYFIPAVYVLAVWHTLAYGSDVKTPNLLWLAVWLMQLPVLCLFIARMRVSVDRYR